MILAIVLSCSGDKIIEIPNSAPVISIQSESGVIEVLENQYESFNAIVSDSDHDLNELEVRWSTEQRVTCDWTPPSDGGESLCVMYLNRSEFSVIAEIRDPQEASTRDEIQVDVLATAVQVTSTSCAASGTSTDPTGNQLFTCLSESGVVGQETSDPSGNIFQSGSIFVYSPE